MDRIEKLTRLVADGRHNAFTSMIQFGKDVFLTYRSSSGHAATDGDIILLHSSDGGENWKERSSPFHGDRNYYEGFLVEFQGRLFMYAGAFERECPVGELLSSTYVSASSDGLNWSVPVPAGCPDWRFWHPLVINDTVFVARYSQTTRKNQRPDGTFPPSNWQVDLACSKDGVAWETVSAISRDEAGNETELFWDGNRLTAFVRRENCPCHLGITHAVPPYAQWSRTEDFGDCVQGMIVRECHGRRFMFGRCRQASPRIGTIYYDRGGIGVQGYVWQPELECWVEYCRLPGRGDCSYPGIIELPGKRVLISYYSQHEYEDFDINGKTDIFLAVVRTDCMPEWGEVSVCGKETLQKKGLL